MNPLTVFLLLGLAGVFMVTRLTQSGIDKIKKHESLRLKPYQDVAGKWTIGWGHLIRDYETAYMRPEGITLTEAEKLLVDDLEDAETAVKRLVKVSLTPGQYDALVSLVFNIGEGNFATSTMLKKINAGDYAGAAAEFPKWRKAGGEVSAGLVARRVAEQQTFLS